MKNVRKTGPKKISILYPLQSMTDQEEKNKKLTRVAAYCRVSSGSEEQRTSYNAQIQYYERSIRENPEYTYAGIYADEGISGTALKKREALNRLMDDARTGQMDMIITKSLSRFGRNTLDCLNIIRELKELGIDLYFEKEDLHTMRSEGEFLLTLIAATAQQESLEQSENVKWGIRRKYEAGNIKSIPSGKFLGYDKDSEGELVINEMQAKTVRRIYSDFLGGYGTYQIANRLTNEKVPMTHGGKAWHASHIMKVLTNEKIKGDTQFQKTYNVDYLTKRRAKNKGELPQKYLENTHPAIIDRKTWEIVQLELLRQKHFSLEHFTDNYHWHSLEHPFSGKIICAQCGHTYIHLSSKKKGEKPKEYWRCKTFFGRKGSPITGKMYTPNAPKGRNPTPSNLRRRKKLEPRQMLCTDIRIDIEKPAEKFIRSWNHLVVKRDQYMAKWEGLIDGEDILASYRIKELMSLLATTGCIDDVPYELMLKTLSHIEVDSEGELKLVFLAGLKI
ncbi:recombinase family protein [Clostridia bacterium]|nr:recombinase family protein [Clostridia bacterium]